eukprot:scaffold676_cov115-Isochrysis_galbana.AAC.9
MPTPPERHEQSETDAEAEGRPLDLHPGDELLGTQRRCRRFAGGVARRLPGSVFPPTADPRRGLRVKPLNSTLAHRARCGLCSPRGAVRVGRPAGRATRGATGSPLVQGDALASRPVRFRKESQTQHGKASKRRHGSAQLAQLRVQHCVAQTTR